MFYIGI